MSDPAEPRDDSDRYDDMEYDEGEIPEGMVICDRCNGEGEVDCRCGGDQCYCGRQEVTCQVCHGEEYITKERWEKRAAAHREIMDALWGKPDASGVRTKVSSQASGQDRVEPKQKLNPSNGDEQP